MNRAPLWMLVATVTLIVGTSAFAFQTANQPIVVSSKGADQSSYADPADTGITPIEASFLGQRAVSAGSRYEGSPGDLAAGIGLPY
jgi:hypothetical protein